MDRWKRRSAPRRLAAPAGAFLLVASLLGACVSLASPTPSSPGAPGPAGETPASATAPAASPSSRVTGTLTTGSLVEVAAGSTTPGTDVTIAPSSTGGAGAGFSIEVPGDAYTTPQSFTVTAAQITGSTFGPLVKPVSDLFTIENGGGYAATPVAVRIPARIPADAIAGAWFYDPASGTLEGVPAVARDETGMTVLTRHFSTIFISIAEAGLPDTIDSGFVPSLDAWQFGNPGAYPEPEGFCSGSATTAMWYFLEQHRGAGAAHLFGTYDNNGGTKTPALWQDDARGIRLATVVQHRTDWGSLASRFFWAQEWIAGKLAYEAFRYAMAVTGEPQLILVRRDGGAHAMVVYKVDPDRLWISDPNFPGEARSTTYDRSAGTLAPYVGGHTYPTILYAAKSAIVPYSDLAAAWAEFTDGTIGNDMFPEVLFYLDRRPEGLPPEPLASGFDTDKPTIRIAYSADTPATARITNYRGSEQLGFDSLAEIPLALGENDIGILAEALVGTDYEWIQFRRFTVVRTAASPSPSAAAGGVWQLVAGPYEIAEQVPLSGAGWVTSGGPGQLESTIGVKNVDFSVVYNWAAPADLVPGDPLSIGSSIGVIKRPDNCENASDAGVCDYAAELYAGLLVMYPPREPQLGPQVVASASARGTSWEATEMPAVPDYDPMYGTDMVLQVGIQHADASLWYQYEYRWTGAP